MCCVGFAPNITLCIQGIKFISLPHLLQFYFSALLHTACTFCNIFYSVQVSFFSVCHLGYYCGVATMLLIHPQFSPITAIKLCNCFKVTINWSHGEIPERFPSSLSTELGWTPVSLKGMGILLHHPKCN